MTHLKCSDYGFECDFMVTGDFVYVAHQFGQHADEVHGIEYYVEAINQIIARKKRWTNRFCSDLIFILMIPKNVFTAFAILFFVSAAIIPIQNLVVWGPDFVYDFYTSNEFTAEKLSIGV